MSEDRRSTFLALLVVGLISVPSRAQADPLTQAETAYGNVDFAETERLAQAALSSGGYDREQMVRIYFLVGVSAAANGKDDEAIDAFKHLLSLDPETKLDRGLSPKLQGPMLEARGTPPAGLSCDVAFDRGKGVLRVAIHDQLTMSRTLLVRSRLSSSAAFAEFRAPSTANVSLAIPGAAGAERVEYTVQLLDEHQNRVFEKGSEAVPEIFQVVAVTSAARAATPERKLPTKWLVLGVVGEILGVAGIAGGAGAYVVGKNAADRWNNDSVCLANGKSRSDNCSGDRSTAHAASSGAIASFAIGGALIAVSTIVLIAAPRETRERAMASATFRCGDGPGLVGVSCGGAF